MNSWFTRITSSIAAVMLLVCCGGSDDYLMVMAASSTRVINEDIQVAMPGTVLEFNNAGSATLVSQLQEGAPADIFISADQETMTKAVAAKVVQDPQEVAQNSLVMIVPADNPAGFSSFSDLGSPHAADASIVVCDPQVPCGRLTTTIAEANSVIILADSWEHSVSDVAAKVSTGQADAGVVYATDAIALGSAIKILEIPHAQQHRNTIMAAVVTDSQRKPEASQVIDTLISPRFAAQWRHHGFIPVSG